MATCVTATLPGHGSTRRPWRRTRRWTSDRALGNRSGAGSVPGVRPGSAPLRMDAGTRVDIVRGGVKYAGGGQRVTESSQRGGGGGGSMATATSRSPPAASATTYSSFARLPTRPALGTRDSHLDTYANGSTVFALDNAVPDAGRRVYGSWSRSKRVGPGSPSRLLKPIATTSSSSTTGTICCCPTSRCCATSAAWQTATAIRARESGQARWAVPLIGTSRSGGRGAGAHLVLWDHIRLQATVARTPDGRRRGRSHAGKCWASTATGDVVWRLSRPPPRRR